MNKDLERARKELDRKETQKMINAINEQNKRKREERLLQEQINKITREKKEKKETIIDFVWVVITFLIILSLTITMLVFLYKDGEKHIKDCTAMGYSEDYCVSQL